MIASRGFPVATGIHNFLLLPQYHTPFLVFDYKMAAPIVPTAVTVSSMMKQHQLKEEDCNKKVSDKHLDAISRSHCRKWRSLPAHLEMATIVVDDIDRELGKEEERRHTFFSKWKHVKGSAATYQRLIAALLEIQCGEDAEGVCKLLQNSLLPKAQDSIDTPATQSLDRETTPIKPVQHCIKHAELEEELKLYCETCGELICLRCALKGGRHHDHNYAFLSEAFEKYTKDVSVFVEPMEKQVETILTTLAFVVMN